MTRQLNEAANHYLEVESSVDQYQSSELISEDEDENAMRHRSGLHTQGEDELDDLESNSIVSTSDHEYGEMPLKRSSYLPQGQHKVMIRRSGGKIVVDSNEFAMEHQEHLERRDRGDRPDDCGSQKSLSHRSSRSRGSGRSQSRSARGRRTSLYVTPIIRRDTTPDASTRVRKQSETTKRRSSMESGPVSKLEDFVPRSEPKEAESFERDDFEKNMASGSTKDRILAIPMRQASLLSSDDEVSVLDEPIPLSPVSQEETSLEEDLDLTPKMKTSKRRIDEAPPLPPVSPVSPPKNDVSVEVSPSELPETTAFSMKPKRKNKVPKGNKDGDGFCKVVPTNQRQVTNKKKTNKSRAKSPKRKARTDTTTVQEIGNASQSESSAILIPSFDEEQDESINDSTKFFHDNDDNEDETGRLQSKYNSKNEMPSVSKQADALSVTGRSLTDCSDCDDRKSPVITSKKGVSSKDSSKAVKSIARIFLRNKKGNKEGKQVPIKESLWNRAFGRIRPKDGSLSEGGEEKVIIVPVP